MTEIIGGIILEKRMPETLPKVTVSWTWFDQLNGTVEWTFKNNTNSVQSFLLFRNTYYFGNAFWPVYINNEGFNEKFATAAIPLSDSGTSNNSAPLCVAEFQDKKRIVCFLFTLSPNQQWSMIEGGFSESFPPSGYSAIIANVSGSKDYCIKYDETQVTDWDSQTGTNYTGYEPNPSTFNTVTAKVQSSFVSLFNDVITPGEC
jgi:hypothetical protein